MPSSDAAEETPGRARPIALHVLVGLGILESAIRLGWSAYGQMQPSLLSRSGLAHLIPPLLVLQGLLGLAMEPLMGGISDAQWRRLGSRSGLVARGLAAAVLLFLLTGITVRLGGRGGAGYVLLALMVAWMAAMNTFRSPAFSLLRAAAPPERLPVAGSVLVLAGALVGAAKPLLGAAIEAAGAPVTFFAGGALLGLAALPLRRLLRTAPPPDVKEAAREPLPAGVALIPVAGLGAALAIESVSRLAMKSAIAAAGAPEAVVTSIILLATSLLCVPAGRLAGRLGARRGILIALVAAIGGVYVAPASAVLGVLAMLAASVLATPCGVAVAMTAAPPSRAGTAIGLWFGGGSLALAVTTLLPATVPPPAYAIGGAAVALGAVARLRERGPGRA